MKIIVPVFSGTLLLSAFLLFSVQPMFSKMVLPLLGGTPQVWNTAMLFFQACLLGGYAYAHIITRFLTPRVQVMIHVFLLIIFSTILPFSIPQEWYPVAGQDPAMWQLGIMAMVVGGPFFVVSGSAPLLQRWFSLSGHKDADNPYFLYGASNLGSMTALLSYPVLIEPGLELSLQSTTWMFGYFALIAFTFISGLMIWKQKNSDAVNSETQDDVVSDSAETITANRRLKWIALSFVPSSLMLGVTTYLTTDIASMPLLWVIPFALYILTFIIVFARKQILTQDISLKISGAAFVLIIMQMLVVRDLLMSYPLLMVALHILVFFAIALTCHYDLAQSKPGPKYLTEFFFFMSLGGVLGGFFNAIIAPTFFVIPLEYVLVLITAAFLRISCPPSRKLKLDFEDILLGAACICLPALAQMIYFKSATEAVFAGLIVAVISLFILYIYRKDRWRFSFFASALLIVSPISISQETALAEKIVLRDRNFFGVHKILEHMNERQIVSGVTNHGTQLLDPEKKLTKVSYYSDFSPLSDVFRFFDNNVEQAPQRIGVLGLGVGVVACYAAVERHFDFFEIDPDIAKIAQDPQYFTYLSDCDSTNEIYIGDGRLEINKRPDQSYDMILADAFSSDNIPAHIITQEAIEMYLRKLKDGGVLVIHISNRYLDLEPVIAAVADEINIPAYARCDVKSRDIAGTKVQSYPSHYVVLTKNQDVITHLTQSKHWTPAIKRENIKAWTDKYSNIFSVFGHSVQKERNMMVQKLLKEEEKSISAEQGDTETGKKESNAE